MFSLLRSSRQCQMGVFLFLGCLIMVQYYVIYTPKDSKPTTGGHRDSLRSRVSDNAPPPHSVDTVKEVFSEEKPTPTADSTYSYNELREYVDKDKIFEKDSMFLVHLDESNKTPTFRKFSKGQQTDPDSRAVFFHQKGMLKGMSFLNPRLSNVLAQTSDSVYAKKSLNGKRLNVHVILIDMVSRHYFRSDMDLVRQFLTSRLISNPHRPSGNVFTAVDFEKLNVNGRNSPFNQLPMVTGWLHDPAYNESHSYHTVGLNKRPISGYSVFDMFKQQGFVTSYENGDHGAVFSTTSRLAHFETLPFYRLWVEKSFVYLGSDLGTYFGRQQAYKMCFDSLQRVVENYPDRPKFTWTKLIDAHEPSHNFLSQMDGDVLSVLQGLERDLKKEHNVVLLLSDHGAHWGWQGRHLYPEYHKNPFFYLLLPEGMLPPHRKNEILSTLEANSHRTISMFDIFGTLRHLSAWLQGDVHTQMKKLYAGDPSVSMRSLFELIPERSCRQMAVPQEYCIDRPLKRLSPFFAKRWEEAAQKVAELCFNVTTPAGWHGPPLRRQEDHIYSAEPTKKEPRLTLAFINLYRKDYYYVFYGEYADIDYNDCKKFIGY
eukprot:GCRY01002075.1.p1 GENE.GCRY01002075.1~~GCRY01002075.1.p1  ORF type:complete len:598 (-),score=145.03 GCRY01002075.1:1972-3765(-)